MKWRLSDDVEWSRGPTHESLDRLLIFGENAQLDQWLLTRVTVASYASSEARAAR